MVFEEAWQVVKGNKCPFCSGNTTVSDTTSFPPGVADDTVTLTMNCDECGKEWTEEGPGRVKKEEEAIERRTEKKVDALGEALRLARRPRNKMPLELPSMVRTGSEEDK